MVVNGVYRGSAASLVSLNEKSFSVTVELSKVSLPIGQFRILTVGLDLA